jgi:sec-independent protein translocase protein TatA
MGSFSIWHWILFLGIVLLLFGGRGKISELMGDFAQGIKSFKKGMQDDDTAKADTDRSDPKIIDHQPPGSAGATPQQRAQAETTGRG